MRGPGPLPLASGKQAGTPPKFAGLGPGPESPVVSPLDWVGHRQGWPSCLLVPTELGLAPWTLPVLSSSSGDT